MMVQPLNVETRLRSMKRDVAKWVIASLWFVALLWTASRISYPNPVFKIAIDIIIVAEMLVLWVHVNVQLVAVELLCALAWAFERDDREAVTAAIGKVNPTMHMKERVLLRNPWKLYSREVREMVVENALLYRTRLWF